MPRLAKWLGDAMEGVLGSKMPLMKVISAYNINPNLKRIIFKGNLSGMTFHLGYATVIRVSDTEYRNYTPSFIDQENGILEIIFHLHGPAPGSLFIDNLKVDDQVRISAPRGIKQYDPAVKRHLVFGDETTLGLAASFQENLKKNNHQFRFYFELDDENEKAPKLLELENYTVFSKKDSFRNEQWINNLPIFKQYEWKNANFVLTGNVKSARNFRKALKGNGITGKIMMQGYWLEGKTGL